MKIHTALLFAAAALLVWALPAQAQFDQDDDEPDTVSARSFSNAALRDAGTEPTWARTILAPVLDADPLCKKNDEAARRGAALEREDEGFAAASGKCGNVTTQRIGDFFYHSDGTVTQKIGDFFYGSDGDVTQKIGDFYYHSDGTSTQRIGDFFYDSDGGTTQRIGGFYYHSGGKPCDEDEK